MLGMPYRGARVPTGDVGLQWGLTGLGTYRFGSFQYGVETEKWQQYSASEKEIQMQLQEEVRLPMGPCPCPWWPLSPIPSVGNDLRLLAAAPDSP